MLATLSAPMNLSLIFCLVFKYRICLSDMLLKLCHFFPTWKRHLLIFRQNCCLMRDLNSNTFLSYTIIGLIWFLALRIQDILQVKKSFLTILLPKGLFCKSWICCFFVLKLLHHVFTFSGIN